MNDAPAPALIAFGLTIALSFLVGLGLREYYTEQGRTKYFGTVRTYVFIGKQRNPLELSSAVLFAFMFVLMTLATKFALDHRTLIGLRELSFLVGFYDIDPFIISLLQSRIAISHEEIAGAVIISTAGNNALKALYVVIFANRSTAVWTVPTFVALAALSLAYLVVIS